MVLIAATSLWVSIALIAITAYFFRPIKQKRVRPYSNAPILTTSLLEKLQNLRGMTSLIQHGYTKYNQGTFQYTTIRGRCQVIVCSDALIAELKNVSDENLSFAAWMQDFHQIDTIFPNYSGGVDMVRWPAFAKLSYRWFKNTLTKDLAETFPQMQKDLTDGWDPEYLAATEDPIYNVSRKCVVSAIGRYLVGEPYCQEPAFLKALDDLTAQWAIASLVASVFPSFLKSYAVRYLTKFEKPRQYVQEKLYELERVKEEKQVKDGYDFFSTVLASREKNQRDDWPFERLITEICTNAFAAIHTTSMTVTTVLLELAARPEYQVTLRDEIKSVVALKGWTLEAIEAMSQLDSFMLETRRFRPLADIMLNRMCLQDTTLSDGTTITPGTTVSVGYSPRLLDDRYYSSPTEFDGLRYYNTQERFTDIDGAKFLGFGAGKHACPGRFFATAMVKTSIAMLLIRYELLPGSKEMEYEMRFEEQRVPSIKDKVLFKPL